MKTYIKAFHEAFERCTGESESLVVIGYVFVTFFPSSTRHVESCVNLQGPPCKAKYSWMTDSEQVLRRKGERAPSARNEREHETVRLQAVGDPFKGSWPRACWRMSQRFKGSGTVNPLHGKAKVKTSLNGRLSLFLDPNPSDLPVTRMKLWWYKVEVPTDRCWKIDGWVAGSGEIPIELGASWFSSKCVEAQRIPMPF